jgi:hypothetical protein
MQGRVPGETDSLFPADGQRGASQSVPHSNTDLSTWTSSSDDETSKLAKERNPSMDKNQLAQTLTRIKSHQEQGDKIQGVIKECVEDVFKNVAPVDVNQCDGQLTVKFLGIEILVRTEITTTRAKDRIPVVKSYLRSYWVKHNVRTLSFDDLGTPAELDPEEKITVAGLDIRTFAHTYMASVLTSLFEREGATFAPNFVRIHPQAGVDWWHPGTMEHA